MADNYTAYLRIFGWPGDDAVFGDPFAGNPEEEPSVEEIERAEILSNIGNQLHYVGADPHSLDVNMMGQWERDGDEVFITAYEASFGAEQFLSDGVCAALTKAGLAWDVRDEGFHEFPGRNVYWKPGMDKPVERTMAGEQIALTKSEFVQMGKEALKENPDDCNFLLLQKIAEHFKSFPSAVA